MRLLQDVAMGYRLLRGVPGYLRRTLTPEDARRIIENRRAHRETDFLAMARDAIYSNPASPYRRLLANAGCELGDLEALVRDDGLENALVSLHRAGVYLTVEEYRGVRTVRRDGLEMAIRPEDLRNPLSAAAVPAATSGTRAPATRVPVAVDLVADRSVNALVTLEAQGGLMWHKAVWGAPGISPLLWYSTWGRPVDAWFTHLELGSDVRYRRSVNGLRAASRLARAPLPAASFVPVDEPLPIARWLSRILADGGIPHLWAVTSLAVRLCEAAKEASIDLTGSRFTIVGEAVTSGRLRAIRAAGAAATTDWGTADAGGFLSYSCMCGVSSDDVHLFDDLSAVVQAGGETFPPDTLFVTTLRTSSPFVWLNVSTGDRATMSTRDCGCPLERYGWRTHLHSIGSFEKLTIAGVTFLDGDVAGVLEDVLPRRFGGGPIDYQLIEDDMRLRLLVAPSVGRVDPDEITSAFLDAVTAASPTLMRLAGQWKRSGFVAVERRMPVPSASGKIQHLRNVTRERTGP